MPYTLTRVTNASSKLTEWEPSSTIDAYKNGKNDYIYSKTTIVAKTRHCIKNKASACLLTVWACRISPIVHLRIGVSSAKFGWVFFVRCHLNCAWLLQGE
jgi:hypothetical protein